VGKTRPFAGQRQALGLTQAEAARALHVSTSYLSRLERGHLPLTLGMAGRMASLYGCSLRQVARWGR
jgi:transcriptional regulator with XRE-family HTH domain